MFFREKKQDKKEKAVEKVLCEKYNSYYRMAYSFVRNEADACDIVQEGAYKAIKNSASLKNIEYASTWVYRIMMNEIYRFTTKKKEVSFDDASILDFETKDQYEDIDLQRALETMSDLERVVIQLKYFEELKLDEIAEITGEKLSTVKSRLYRGLRKLREELDYGVDDFKEVKYHA